MNELRSYRTYAKHTISDREHWKTIGKQKSKKQKHGKVEIYGGTQYFSYIHPISYFFSKFCFPIVFLMFLVRTCFSLSSIIILAITSSCRCLWHWLQVLVYAHKKLAVTSKTFTLICYKYLFTQVALATKTVYDFRCEMVVPNFPSWTKWKELACPALEVLESNFSERSL